MTPVAVARWNDLEDRVPAHALVGNVDLVAVRFGGEVSVLYGRCLHRGALLADGYIEGDDLICGVHKWDYQIGTGVSSYNPGEILAAFPAWIEDGTVWIDGDDVAAWERTNPQRYDRSAYQGGYQDLHGTPDEPHVAAIRELAAGDWTESATTDPSGQWGFPAPSCRRGTISNSSRLSSPGFHNSTTSRSAPG